MNFRPIRSAIISTALLLTAVSFGAPASAQLPAGMSLGEIQSILSNPIAVPAGESVTVDVGVPVSGGHHGSGWDVTSAGTTVTVVAPEDDGASVSVPMTAVGQTVTITLVAEQEAPVSAPVPVQVDPPAVPTTEATSLNQRPMEAAAPTTTAVAREEVAAPTPQASISETTETAAATATATEPATPAEKEVLDFEAEIEGNTITVQVGLGQAAQLARQFADIGGEGVELRYRDAEGNPIEGVTYELDTSALSITFTYPDGTTPDNPFLVDVVRDGDAVATARLTAPSVPERVPASTPASSEALAQTQGPSATTYALGAAALLAVAIGAGVATRRKRKRANFAE